MKYFSLGGGGGVSDFMVTISLFPQKKWLTSYRACVYHHRMKPKVGRNFTSERGGGGSREKWRIFHFIGFKVFLRRSLSLAQHSTISPLGWQGCTPGTRLIQGIRPLDLRHSNSPPPRVHTSLATTFQRCFHKFSDVRTASLKNCIHQSFNFYRINVQSSKHK